MRKKSTYRCLRYSEGECLKMIFLNCAAAILQCQARSDQVAEIFRRSPTWGEWRGKKDEKYAQIVKALVNLSEFTTADIIKGSKKYLSAKPRNEFNKDTLLYLAGRYLFAIPSAPLNLAAKETATCAPEGIFNCQPIALDSNGGPIIVFTCGRYRGGGYPFESEFRYLEKRFGRRKKPPITTSTLKNDGSDTRPGTQEPSPAN